MGLGWTLALAHSIELLHRRSGRGFRCRDQGTPMGSNAWINHQQPIAESIRKFAPHPLFKRHSFGRIG